MTSTIDRMNGVLEQISDKKENEENYKITHEGRTYEISKVREKGPAGSENWVPVNGVYARSYEACSICNKVQPAGMFFYQITLDTGTNQKPSVKLAEIIIHYNKDHPWEIAQLARTNLKCQQVFGATLDTEIFKEEISTPSLQTPLPLTSSSFNEKEWIAKATAFVDKGVFTTLKGSMQWKYAYNSDSSELLDYIKVIIRKSEFQKNPNDYLNKWIITRGNKDTRLLEDPALDFFKTQLRPSKPPESAYSWLHQL